MAIETATTVVSKNGPMAAMPAVCRSYAKWKESQLLELRAERSLRLAEDDELGVEIAETRIAAFDSMVRPMIERMRKKLKPYSRSDMDSMDALWRD